MWIFWTRRNRNIFDEIIKKNIIPMANKSCKIKVPGNESKVERNAKFNNINAYLNKFLPKKSINFLLNRNCRANNQINKITEEAWDGSEKKNVKRENDVLPVNKINVNNFGSNIFKIPVIKKRKKVKNIKYFNSFIFVILPI